MSYSMQKKAVVVVALLAIGFTAGCSDNGQGGKKVTGRVTLDGKPLPDGSITFLPEKTGTTVGGKIHDGVYNISRAEGPLPGLYRVYINRSMPTGKMLLDSDGVTKVPEFREVVPACYNLQTKLSVTVTSEGSNNFNFELQP